MSSGNRHKSGKVNRNSRRVNSDRMSSRNDRNSGVSRSRDGRSASGRDSRVTSRNHEVSSERRYSSDRDYDDRRRRSSERDYEEDRRRRSSEREYEEDRRSRRSERAYEEGRRSRRSERDYEDDRRYSSDREYEDDRKRRPDKRSIERNKKNFEKNLNKSAYAKKNRNAGKRRRDDYEEYDYNVKSEENMRFSERSRTERSHSEGSVSRVFSVITGKLDENIVTKYDYTLLIVVFLLVAFGLVMVTSASSYAAVKLGYKPTFYMERQMLFVLVGIVMLIVISKIDYKIYFMKIPGTKYPLVLLFYLLCVTLQVMVYLAGSSSKGSQRWLELPVIGRFQPSELSKICIILFVAYMASEAPRELDRFRRFLSIGIISAILIGLVIGENLSTALVMAGIFFLVCFITSTKWWYYIFTFVALFGLALVATFGVSYRADRIEQWLDVEHKGYQILQGLYAICSGGWLGKGIGNSVQKLGYIPEVHTDMIFSVICEELGVLGVILLLLVYAVLFTRLYKIAVNAPDLLGSLICVGVLVHFALQVLLNIAVVTNTLPSTGVTLPFISYGGTSVLCMFMEIGIVLSISSRIEHNV